MKNEEIKKYQDFLKLKGFQLKKSKENFYQDDGIFWEYLVTGDDLWKIMLCEKFNKMFNENICLTDYIQVVGLRCNGDVSECAFFADFSYRKMTVENFLQFVEEVM